jgi:hypothetical protein
MTDLRQATYPGLDIDAIDAARSGVSPELAAGIARAEADVADYVARLGGYGALVTARCGSAQIERTGTLAPAATLDQWPHIVTDEGRHYQVRPVRASGLFAARRVG